MAEHHPPGHIICNKDGYLVVAVGDGAQMSCPTGRLVWRLTWGDEPASIAAGVIEAFEYLLLECSKEEAWRRMRIMRAAMREAKKQEPANAD